MKALLISAKIVPIAASKWRALGIGPGSWEKQSEALGRDFNF
jgi:hypothetical protein